MENERRETLYVQSDDIGGVTNRISRVFGEEKKSFRSWTSFNPFQKVIFAVNWHLCRSRRHETRAKRSSHPLFQFIP